MPKQTQKPKHIPVLLQEVIDVLNPKTGESYVDMTAGYGGHAESILSISGNYGDSYLVDRDNNAINTLQSIFGELGINLMNCDYLEASKKLATSGQRFDMILADVGISSPHIDNASRGFTFIGENPLDMRMDQTQKLNAETIVNSYSEEEIISILRKYGEEPRARLITKMIIENRPISNTAQLAQIVAKAYPGYSKRHPATRTFQALRIAVNDELGQLEQALPLWLDLLSPGGRLAVISFHSLEDRLVKQIFKASAVEGYDSEYKSLTRRPITATNEELVFNPRSRSAKLRAVEKNKNKERE
ncbi:MAG: 16S rRNA (cytosine(1402)-N(4))-methyltransferase RsmH [bacterium]|nr:16S rRNA (cytosine(1402)-N(4))-methyltransferase RsmH [bacterium]